MTRESVQHRRTTWLVVAQAIGAIGSLVALVITLSRPVRYVADLATAVDRLADAATRLEASARQQEERLTAAEQGLARVGAGLEEARRISDIQEARIRELERRR